MTEHEEKKYNPYCKGPNFKKKTQRPINHHIKPKTAKEAVPTLQYGQQNNWIEFRKRMGIAATEKYGNLGLIIEQEKYYEPPAIHPALYKEDPNDPFELYKIMVHEAVNKEISKEICRMKNNRSNLYAFILSKLSCTSEDELKRHKDFEKFHADVDPLSMWIALKELHLVTTQSKTSAIICLQASEDYEKLHQGGFEKLTSFKERFDIRFQAYNTSLGNPQCEERSAMQFLSKINRNRYRH